MKIHVKYYMMYERFENGGETMNTIECMKTRRSIRKFKPDPVNHATLESVIEAASYSPSWKTPRSHVIQQLKILLFLIKSLPIIPQISMQKL